MTLANKLTIARVIAVPFLVVFLLADNWTDNPGAITLAHWLALAIFVGATVTDYYDGVIARRSGTVTHFGALMDPLADKLLTMAALVALVEVRFPADRPVFPAWAVILILAREFLVTGMRTLAASRGRVIAADRWGKHKTGWQLGVVIGILASMALHNTLGLLGVTIPFVDLWLPRIYMLLLAIIVGLTVLSGTIFVMNNRDLLDPNEH